ncbi:MAG: Thiol-disulfide oxidoreductase ResA [Pseudomonas citronellolis]|nr:MAG: Thiol-disulfide oxidoreductase ResA [Pseudomonas citronellolis]
MLSVSLGPLLLSTAHLALLLALGCATLAGWCVGRGRQVSVQGPLFNLLLLGLFAARAGFVALYWPQYRDAPWQVLDIRDGGFWSLPGVIVGVLGAGFYAWRRPAWRAALATGVVVGLGVWLLALQGLEATQRGRQLPALNLRTLAGAEAPLVQAPGRPLVLNLWASWCPPCRREMPALQAAQQRYPQFDFVFVNQGEDAPSVEQFLKASGLTLAQVRLDEAAELGRAVGSGALPTTLFYSAEGRLLGSHLGELSAASLDHALAALAPAVSPVRGSP